MQLKALTAEQVYGGTPVAPGGWDFTSEWVDATISGKVVMGVDGKAHATGSSHYPQLCPQHKWFGLELRKKCSWFVPSERNGGWFASAYGNVRPSYMYSPIHDVALFATKEQAQEVATAMKAMCENYQEMFASKES